MKSLILAAGYATRLYPLTLDRAKPLLPVAGRPAIEHIIGRIEDIDEVEQILVVTNQKFSRQFIDWAKGFSAKKPIKILNDKTLSEKDRLGAIGDIVFAINQEAISDDLLVIAGDNLFELGLREFVDFAKQKIPASSIGLYNLKNLAAVRRYSEVRVDEQNKITHFVEKPAHPTSTLVAKCIYFFPQEKLKLFFDYMGSGGSADQPGNYISWLSKRDVVYGFNFLGRWYDIGNYEIYQKADKVFSSLTKEGR